MLDFSYRLLSHTYRRQFSASLALSFSPRTEVNGLVPYGYGKSISCGVLYAMIAHRVILALSTTDDVDARCGVKQAFDRTSLFAKVELIT